MSQSNSEVVVIVVYPKAKCLSEVEQVRTSDHFSCEQKTTSKL